MAKVTNEVVTKFSFKGSIKPLAGFNRSLTTGIKVLSSFSVAAVGAASAFTAWVGSTLAGRDALAQLSAETGVAIGRVQELGYIASVSGSSADALQGTLQNLSKSIGDASRGVGSAASEFSRLGISVRNSDGTLKNSGQVLDEVRRRFNDLGLSMDQRRSMASALGIDQSLIQMLSRTDGEMSRLAATAKSLGTLSKQDSEQIRAFNDSVTTLRFGFSALQDRIAIGFAPELSRMTEGFITFLDANKDLIANGITKLGEGLNVIAQAAVRLAPLIGIMTAMWVALNATMLLNPAVLIAAAIVGLILVVDDLIVGLQGGKSVVADFFQSFLGWDIIAPLRAFVEFIKQTVIPAIKSLPFADKIMGMFGGSESASTYASGSAAASQAAASSVSTRTANIEQQNTFQITTSDPVRAGGIIEDTLQRQMADAERVFSGAAR